MVRLTRIYTRLGDAGDTHLGDMSRVRKTNLRIEAFGDVDEANSAIGVARATGLPEAVDAWMALVQNDLFDVGADLAVPDRPGKAERLRVMQSQVERLERDIDELNAHLAPLTSFVLPAGHAGAAYLHVARTVCRRAERLMAELASREGEEVNPAALKYMNRLSDFLFVAARSANDNGTADVLWVPGQNR